MRNLREHFLQGSPGRLAQIEASIARLESDPGDIAAFADLRLAFHAFAGLGGSYGFPRVTTLGLDGESQCGTLAASGRVPGEAELRAWRGLLEGLRSELKRP